MDNLTIKLRILRLMIWSAAKEWRNEVWRRDLDERYCCDGHMCGCGAMTVRELWDAEINVADNVAEIANKAPKH